ncbi:MAG: hypothetical protein DI626_09550 [Micavibrio aeruginosavorus]|uniref:Uncharacterized protein n=1 Tax=Micavibrio aeruginosavorus TaxID=349221 RepID=A0A2W4ZNQ9_9BACT|nr:MAG: hypothetical protein DI626_09550 [Micavibrio aeruginosavorus]
MARSPHQKFTDAICKEADLVPDNCAVLGPAKEKKRLIEKAVARYDGDVFQVSDATRSRILIDNPKSLKTIKDTIMSVDFRRQYLERGINVLSVEDFFEKPTQTKWRGLVIKTEIDIGKGRTQKAETVVIPRGWVDDYETTHTYLENIRALKDRAQAQNRKLSRDETQVVEKYTEMSKGIHDKLAADDGYIHLENSGKKKDYLKLVVR